MQKLQQAMDEEADYHDPPPPPPHLMALTQGFKVSTPNFFLFATVAVYNVMYITLILKNNISV